MSLIASAKIGRSHGLGGHLKIQPFGDNLSHLHSGEVCFLRRPGQSDIESVIDEIGDGRIKFKGYDTKEEAAKLSGSILMIEYDRAQKKKKGEYFIADFFGLIVTHNGERVGKITAVSDSASPVLLIAETAGGERMIPYYPGVFVKEPDLESGTIEVIMGEILE